MEWIEHLERGLAEVAALGKLCLEAISVFCVLFGLFKILQLAIRLNRLHYAHFPFIQLRIGFGTWLALALEFQLGADILGTTVAPTLEALARLAVVAVIRTFLNFFLNKELEKQLELQEMAQDRESLKVPQVN
jgi:uncharacterized membrane protein